MKVAVISDVQGNLPALETAVEHILSWRPELVVMAGDLINRGPSSLGCLEQFDGLRHSEGWLPVKGNHEDWVLRCGREAPTDALDADMRRFADWTYRQISPAQEKLDGWPDHLSFHGTDAESWVHVTHGTLAGNRDGISASVRDEDLLGRLPEGVALFVTAHTHKPLQRIVNGIHVLNVGSVGSPFDGDPRGSYGQLEYGRGCWQARIVRLPYDRHRTERDFLESGFIDEGGPLARIVYEEWRRARLLMPTWHERYRPAVQAGTLSLERAVWELLQSIG
jgi:predicted phosphodiesterase